MIRTGKEGQLGRTLRALWALGLVSLAATARAEESRWSFALGGGAYASSAYEGSDETFIAPTPYARADYERGRLSLRLSLVDGVTLMYTDLERRLLATFEVGWGEARYPDSFSVLGSRRSHDHKTEALLAGSDSVESPLRVESKVGWISAVGIVGVALEVRPVSVGAGAERLCALPSAFYLLPLPLGERTQITGLVRLRFMDENYADAWYDRTSGPQQEEGEGSFDAEAGFQDLQAVVQVEHSFSKRLSVLALFGASRLLGDAAASPYTASPYRLVGGAYALYTF